jgi:Esterase-like activity of phytase
MIYKIDPTQKPAVIVESMFLSDWDGVLRDALENDFGMDNVTIDAILNGNHSVNLDIQGLDTSVHGGFWVTNEASGSNTTTETKTPDLLMYANKNGVIKDVIPLPDELNEKQLHGHGMSGVAEDYLSNTVVVTFHSALHNETDPRIGIWNRDTEEWSFVFYPTDAPESQYEGSTVVIGDISFSGVQGVFLIMEYDNRAGPDAAVKHINGLNLTDYEPDSVVEKIVGLDIIPDNLRVATYGPIVEKVSGVTVDRDRVIWVLNDNEGNVDNNGETLLIRVGVLPEA